MPAISVIIPTFRRPHYLAQALASITAQRLPDDVELEVLVCDNAADEETAALVRATDDPRIVHIPRPRNLGMMRNAVAGFARPAATSSSSSTTTTCCIPRPSPHSWLRSARLRTSR